MEYFIEIWKSVTPFFSSIAWPLVAISFLWIVREPLKELIRRIEEITLGNFGARATPSTKQAININKSPFGNLENENLSQPIEDALKKFSKETNELVENIVKTQTKYESLDQINRVKALLQYSKLALLFQFFNHIYLSIYGSQIRILQFLNSNRSATIETIKPYYAQARIEFPKVYKSYSFEDYLRYLSFNNLIEISTEKIITITMLGRDFLQYLTWNRLPLDIPN